MYDEDTFRMMWDDGCVFGRYDLRRRLGHGGTGEVWLAHDRELKSEVALKFLINFFNDEETDILRRETKLTRNLNHRHILPVYDFHYQEGAPAAISMEYAPGGSLEDLISKAKPVLEVSDIRDWMFQVCNALAYAHEECGIIHRDIKPSNILLDDALRVKIADFGIAAYLATRLDEESEKTIGTRICPEYASPQLALNPHESHYLNDIYAIGATIFWLLTGSQPFKDPRHDRWAWDPDNLFTMSGRRERDKLGEEPIPPEWDYAVARCLAEDPLDRPGSVRELAELLIADGDGDGGEVLDPKGQDENAVGVPADSPVENETGPAGVSRRFRLPFAPLVGVLIVAALGLLAGILWGLFEWYGDGKPVPDTGDGIEFLGTISADQLRQATVTFPETGPLRGESLG